MAEAPRSRSEEIPRARWAEGLIIKDGVNVEGFCQDLLPAPNGTVLSEPWLERLAFTVMAAEEYESLMDAVETLDCIEAVGGGHDAVTIRESRRIGVHRSLFGMQLNHRAIFR